MTSYNYKTPSERPLTNIFNHSYYSSVSRRDKPCGCSVVALRLFCVSPVFQGHPQGAPLRIDKYKLQPDTPLKSIAKTKKPSGPNGTKLSQKPTPPVIPAKAGIQRNSDIGGFWIPAFMPQRVFAGKTAVFGLSSRHSCQARF